MKSGNAAFRDRATRERLRKDLGVLCVEMEAAGLIRAGEMTGVVVALQAPADAKSRELIQIRHYLLSACKADHMSFAIFANDSAPFGIQDRLWRTPGEIYRKYIVVQFENLFCWP